MEVEGIKEDIREFIYLGYVVQKNRWQEAHVRKRVRRAALVMGQVWGIGKRRFGRDWERRVWMLGWCGQCWIMG